MPEIRRARFLQGDGVVVSSAVPCAFVVSVGEHTPDAEALCAGWRWTRARFDACTVLLGDSLHRLTLQTSQGLDEAASEKEASRRAEALVDRLSAVDSELPLIRTSEVSADPAFPAVLRKFEEAFRRSTLFRAAVEEDAFAYCDRQVPRGRLAIPPAEARAIAARYLLEEVAVYDLLANRGWLAETYLGRELRVLEGFMHRRFPGLSSSLDKRIHISLELQRIKEAA